MLAPNRPDPLDIVQLPFYLGHTLADLPEVLMGPDLTSGQEARALALLEQIDGLLHQGDPMAQCGELDLELRLLAPGLPGEYLQDEPYAVENLDGHGRLEVVDLGWLQLVVHDDEVSTKLLYRVTDLLRLPATHVGAGVGSVPSLYHRA